MHLVVTFAKAIDDREVSVKAAREGLWVMPLSSCHVGRAVRRGFVLGFAGTDARGAADAVRKLGGLLREGSPGKD